MAHRGSYKTSTISLFLAIHAIIKPKETVLYFRKTDTNVQEISRQVQKILSTGVFKMMVYILYGQELKLTKATGNAINTNLNTSVKGADQITGLGIGSSVTGIHCDICVVDDASTQADRFSRAERERTRLAFLELQNICNRNDGKGRGRFIVTGTRWHADDIFGIIEEKGEKIQIYDCYTTGLMSQEMIEDKKKTLTHSLFCANYLLKVVSDEELIFKDPNFLNEDEFELIYEGVAHIDASYGGADYTAYTIMHKLDDGRIIAYGNTWEKHVDKCIGEIIHWHKKYHAGSVYCETNGDKGYLADELENKYGFYVRKYHEHTNKFIKICSYLLAEWENIYWLPSTSEDYMEMVLNYTETAPHDDCPDSASSLIRELTEQATMSMNPLLIGGIL